MTRINLINSRQRIRGRLESQAQWAQRLVDAMEMWLDEYSSTMRQALDHVLLYIVDNDPLTDHALMRVLDARCFIPDIHYSLIVRREALGRIRDAIDAIE